VSQVDHSIQVGDFGIGFGIEPLDNVNHKFIRGNHDDPALCQEFPNFIRDGSVGKLSDDREDWMAIGGAFSIDWMYRQPGRSWWHDEECHEYAFQKYFETYKEVKPKIMFTHDCPHWVAKKLFESTKLINASHTSKWLDIFRKEHKPDLWMFGHWHEARDQIIDGTRYVCLPELGYMDIDL